MGFQFWFSFFLFALISFLTACFIGFLFVENHFHKKYRLAVTEKLELESVLYKREFKRKLNFLKKEKNKIQTEKTISSESPFFALFIFSDSGEELFYVQEDELSRFGSKKNNISGAFSKSSSVFDSKGSPGGSVNLERKNSLFELAKRMNKELPLGFFLKRIEKKNQNPDFILVKFIEKGERWLGFLKFDPLFFKWKAKSLQNWDGERKEAFVINSQGRVFFHNRGFRIFKRISKKSELWQDIFSFLKHNKDQKKQSLFYKKEGKEDIYYLEKWTPWALLFLSKSSLSVSPFFQSSKIWLLSVGIFLLFSLLFFRQCFSLASAYQFLKFAFLSFDKTKIMPSADSLSNTLLYFYKNRQGFINQKARFQISKKPSPNLTFQELIKQELEKIKSRFPRLHVQEEYFYDTRLFAFKRFLKTIVHEILLNSVEAMGSLKEPKLEISLKKENRILIFCVRDYGVGLPDEDYEKLFKMYYSSKSQMGVGLNLVQSLVSANGGQIKFSSPQGGGLKVCIFLPLKSFLTNSFQSMD